MKRITLLRIAAVLICIPLLVVVVLWAKDDGTKTNTPQKAKHIPQIKKNNSKQQNLAAVVGNNLKNVSVANISDFKGAQVGEDFRGVVKPDVDEVLNIEVYGTVIALGVNFIEIEIGDNSTYSLTLEEDTKYYTFPKNLSKLSKDEIVATINIVDKNLIQAGDRVMVLLNKELLKVVQVNILI